MLRYGIMTLGAAAAAVLMLVLTGPRGAERPRPEAAVRVTGIRGRADLVRGGDRRAVEAGMGLVPGDRIGADAGSAVHLRYPDGTTLSLSGGPVGALLLYEAPRRVRLERGGVLVSLAERPEGGAMVFVTPHAEAAALGTCFMLEVTRDSSRLEVTEGRVRFTRRSDGAAVDVEAGQYAEAGEGLALVARRIGETGQEDTAAAPSRPAALGAAATQGESRAPAGFPEEILLQPQDGRIVGDDWRLVPDGEAATGRALDAAAYTSRWASGEVRRGLANLRSFAEFTFRAAAGREYHLWVQGRSLADRDRFAHDEVAVEVPGASFSRPCPFLLSRESGIITGYAGPTGYSWRGEVDDEGLDPTPISIRFPRSGEQTLRLYVIESPIRVGAVWLSTTQKTRPAASSRGPAEPGE